MGKKVFGALLLIVAISVFLTIREEGVENAFGGALAPLASASEETSAAPLAGLAFSEVPTSGTSHAQYEKLTDRVRDRVNSAMRSAEGRAGRY